MSSRYETNDQNMDEENDIYEEFDDEEEQQDQDDDESQEELEKIQEDLNNRTKIIPPHSINQFKLDSIESKINQLLLSAEQYASFLLSRHKQAQRKIQPNQVKSRHRIVVDEEEGESNAGIDDDIPTRLTKQPSLLKGGELKDYQMNGLNWLISLYETGINGILADEMGLGKTIQTIAFIAFLKEYKRINGPFMVVAPKSTLGNWMKEFKKWMPCCRVLKLIALKEERDDILNKWLQPGKFDVCLTSYEGVNICLKQIRRFHFKYIIIDEAHKIKNEEAAISKNMRRIKTNYKLLLSGTPLQNTPHELWSLLNYLLPDLFDSSEVFDKWFEVNAEQKSSNECKISQEELEKKNLEMVQKFHKILRPFMLRRTKAEVERQIPPKKEIHLFIKLTSLQRQIYQNIIVSNNPFEAGEDKGFYMNKLMQLRKVCLHPYLFPEVEDKNLPPLGEHLIEVSGKLMVLDKLLQKLQKEHHQVLLFSQFTMMLNILEDYCNFREYSYCRIDGDTDIELRDDQIADFTAPGSTKQIFLLSTRAGGLGINLASADTVVIYDSDFNPQMDLQAMDRAHRIGQKNQVMVYRLVSEHTVEEKIIERQQIKLRWDSLMIQQGRMQKGGVGRLLSKDELREITLFGSSQVFKLEGEITEEDINLLLQRGEEKTQEMNDRIDKRFQSLRDKKLDLGLGQINIFDYFEDNKRTKEDEEAMDEAMAMAMHMENKTRRDKKALNYNLNHMFSAQAGNKRLHGKVIKLQEHHLYLNRDRLQALLQKEEDFVTQQKFIRKFGSHTEKEQGEGEVNTTDVVQDDNNLTAEERQEVQELQATGFTDWTKQEFIDFIAGSERYGRNAIEQIQGLIKTKSVDELRTYKMAFWSRLEELTDKDKYVKQIERGEKMLNQRNEGQRLIEEKCTHFHCPRYELNFTPQLYNKFKSKYFSSENDKYLIYAVNEVGYGNWAQLKKMIRLEAMFKFDHAFKCKTENELKNRITSLLKVLEKEKENNSLGRPLVKQQPVEKPRALQETKANKKTAQPVIVAKEVVQYSYESIEQSEKREKGQESIDSMLKPIVQDMEAKKTSKPGVKIIPKASRLRQTTLNLPNVKRISEERVDGDAEDKVVKKVKVDEIEEQKQQSI